MRKCCKKAGYTQETTDALLHKALQDAPPSKSKAKEPEPPADIPTLLADIQPPEKKKRVRAVQVTSSVMDVRETGDEIRNRALQFLQGSSESPEPNRQQAAFPATQAFGQSRLGAAKATKSLFATDDDSASEAEAPAPIQQFGKSKLSANRSKKSLFAVDDPSGSASEAEGTGSPSKKKARGTRFSPVSPCSTFVMPKIDFSSRVFVVLTTKLKPLSPLSQPSPYTTDQELGGRSPSHQNDPRK
jgi:hypothetical protein